VGAIMTMGYAATNKRQEDGRRKSPTRRKSRAFYQKQGVFGLKTQRRGRKKDRTTTKGKMGKKADGINRIYWIGKVKKTEIQETAARRGKNAVFRSQHI
jgi:hypothetical protein